MSRSPPTPQVVWSGCHDGERESSQLVVLLQGHFVIDTSCPFYGRWDQDITFDNWWPVSACLRVCDFIDTCAHVHACILTECAIPLPASPSPHYPACQWCGPLIGGPGLSRHGNCTKANKGVEQSRGNTVTQRGYLAQWKISGEAYTKAKPLLNTRVHDALFCLSLKTPRLNTQMSKSAVC